MKVQNSSARKQDNPNQQQGGAKSNFSFANQDFLSTLLMLCIAITFLGYFGAIYNDFAEYQKVDGQYRKYIQVTLAGTVLGMFALLLAILEFYYHEKNLIIASLVFLFVGWVLFFAGMIIGANYFAYNGYYENSENVNQGNVVALWLIYSFMAIQSVMNIYVTL